MNMYRNVFKTFYVNHIIKFRRGRCSMMIIMMAIIMPDDRDDHDDADDHWDDD